METILQLDYNLIFWVQEHCISSILTPFMSFISTITSSGALWIVISILLMLQKKYRVVGLGMFISLVLVFIIGDQGLKPHVARLRPFVDFPNVPLVATPPAATSYSFPSGHSFGSFASAMALYLGLSQINPTKRFWGIIALMGSVVVAFSRVYLFVHYPSDVITGMVLGLIVGYVAWKIAVYCWTWWINRKCEIEYEPYTFKRKDK